MPYLNAKSSFWLMLVGLLLAGCNSGQGITCYNDAETQTDMNLCGLRRAQAANEELQSKFYILLKRTMPKNQAMLKVSHEAWQEFKQKHCGHRTRASEGGSVHSMALSECYVELTRDYIQLIERQLHCTEGDVTCSR